MLFETNKDKGRAGLSMAIAYFGSNGYCVNIPLNDTQWYDLVIEKDGVFQTVQCKATGSSTNEIKLKSSGGTKGSVYDNILNHPLDILFCLDEQQNMYVIPMNDLKSAGNVNSIKLRTEKSLYANAKTFDTSKYLVKL